MYIKKAKYVEKEKTIILLSIKYPYNISKTPENII